MHGLRHRKVPGWIPGPRLHTFLDPWNIRGAPVTFGAAIYRHMPDSVVGETFNSNFFIL